MRPATFWLLLALCLAGPAPSAWAQNPRVSLTLKDVTCAEVAAAVEKSTGAPIHLQPSLLKPPPPEQRLSFRWQDTSLADVLRDVAGRYGRTIVPRAGGGYVLLHESLRPAGTSLKPPVLAAEKQVKGLRIGVASIRVYGTKGSGEAHAFITLNVDALGADLRNLRGLTEVAARDDLGNICLGAIHQRRLVLPDTWQVEIEIPLSPAASRLEWLEADLEAYRKMEQAVVEVPLPLPSGENQREALGARFQVVAFKPGQEPAPASFIEQQYAGPIVDVAVETPEGLDFSDPQQGIGTPICVLLGKSGHTYGPLMRNGHRRAEFGQAARWEENDRFSSVFEPLTAVRWSVLRRSDPEVISTFRLTGIPLPSPASTPTSPVPFVRSVEPEASRFTDPAGGALRLPLSFGGQATVEGDLMVGLRPLGAKNEATEWIKLGPATRGDRRLRHLRPGRYRLLRLFAPKRPRDDQPAGSWANAEVEVEIRAGAETTAPVLEWRSEKEGKR